MSHSFPQLSILKAHDSMLLKSQVEKSLSYEFILLAEIFWFKHAKYELKNTSKKKKKIKNLGMSGIHKRFPCFSLPFFLCHILNC